VLVEDIINQSESEMEEGDVDPSKLDPYIMGQKIKAQDIMDITLPYLPDTVVVVDDMMGKVPTLKYIDHDVRDASKFPYLDEDNYLINTGEIRTLDKTIMEPAQWITELYKYGIMKLLDILHFGHGKNVRLYIKQLFSRVHGGILWMDRPIHMDVALIAKITGLLIVDM
jgi:hypothetical protein